MTGLLPPSSAQSAPPAPDSQLARTIVKVIAQSSDWKSNMGSGVIIAADKVATNCHVTRNAQKIILVQSGRYYPAIAQAVLAELDVCLLQTRHMPTLHASLADGSGLVLGNAIKIYGYPLALGMRVLQGAIVGLHRFHDQDIIEISAGFMQGASGGGVFNDSGKLIGLTTFMGRKRDGYHFYAIPVSWLHDALKAKFEPIRPFSSISFWESGEFEHSTNQEP